VCRQDKKPLYDVFSNELIGLSLAVWKKGSEACRIVGNSDKKKLFSKKSEGKEEKNPAGKGGISR